MLVLDMPEKIETDRLILNRLRHEDAEEIFYSYASKPEATKYLSWATHDSVDKTRAFVQYADNSWRLGLDYTFAIRMKRSGRLIGSFGVVHEEGKVQFGYVISPSEWGRGFATEACLAMMGVLRGFSSLHRVGTFVDAENVASVKVLEKCGLVEEARLPSWFRFVNQGNRPKDCVLFRLDLLR